MKRKRICVSVALLLGLTICMIAGPTGCISPQTANEQPKKKHLSVMMFDYGNAPADESLTDNRFTKYVNKCMSEYGIEVEYNVVPWIDEEEYVKKLMVSGNASDIMICSNRTMVQNYYPEGYSHNLSLCISAEKTPELIDFIGEEGYEATVYDSGEHWAIQAVRTPLACNSIFIRKDWLDLLGLEIPETTEELYEVIKKFSTLSPDKTVTGEPVIPAHLIADGSVGPLACSFLTTISDAKRFSASSNDIYGVMLMSDPGYAEYLKYLNRLYCEGLLDRSFLVSGRDDAALREGVLSGRIGVFEAPWNYQISKAYGSLLERLRSADSNADIISISPLKNVHDGNCYNMSLGSSGNYIFVPLSCEAPETAATYLNWLASSEGGGKLFELTEGSEWIRKSLFILENDGYYLKNKSLTDVLSTEYSDNLPYLENNIENAKIGTVERSSYYTYTSAFFGFTLRSACKRNTLKVITTFPEKFDSALSDYLDEITLLGAGGIISEQTTE